MADQGRKRFAISDKDRQVVSALDGRRLKDAGLETHLQSVHYGELTIASASEASSDSNGAEYGIDFDTGNLVHIDAVSQISMLYMLDAGGETDEAAVKAIGSALGLSCATSKTRMETHTGGVSQLTRNRSDAATPLALTSSKAASTLPAVQQMTHIRTPGSTLMVRATKRRQRTGIHSRCQRPRAGPPSVLTLPCLAVAALHR